MNTRVHGRPTRHESQQRKTRFLQLAAQGQPLDQAAKTARIKPERALRIITPLTAFTPTDPLRRPSSAET